MVELIFQGGGGWNYSRGGGGDRMFEGDILVREIWRFE